VNSELEAERDSVRQWAEAEQCLIDTCTKLGVAWTVLRPTIIYDEGRDANITRLARLIEKFGFTPLAGSGSGLRRPVHAEDMAIGAKAAAASPAAAKKISAIPGTDTVSYREMIGRIFDGLHKPRRIILVPPLLRRAAFAPAKPFIANAIVAMGNRTSKDDLRPNTCGAGFRLETARDSSGLPIAAADIGTQNVEITTRAKDGEHFDHRHQGPLDRPAGGRLHDIHGR
jgi:uncharacterized protein YbjT (DUF2867 family)